MFKVVYYREKDPMYATPIKRFLAYIVDCLFVLLIFYLLTSILKRFGIDTGLTNDKIVLKDGLMSYGNDSDTSKIFYYLLSIEFLYFVTFLSSKRQATLGNQIFKIMVVHKKNIKMTVVSSFVRHLSLIVNSYLYYIGFLSYFFRKDGAFLYDIYSNTSVINLTKKTKQ